MREPRQKAYIGQIEHLLDVSERTRIPLVAYVAASHADDISSMVSRLGGLGERSWVSDAQLFGSIMTGWGSRCRFYRCARDDRVLSVNGHKYYQRVLITYLQTSADKLPVRLELPEWVLASDRHEWVLDVVRAECVVGIGYPYALETADAVAVLTGQDRERFLAIFQQFVGGMKLALSFSDKEISKRHRR